MSETRPCALCASASDYAFGFAGQKARRCHVCGLLFLDPQPSEAELGRIQADGYFLSPPDDAAMKATAQAYLAELKGYHQGNTGRLLEVNPGRGEFLAEAAKAGFEVTGVEASELAAKALPEASFDVIALFNVIERVRDPRAFLAEIRRLLRPGGTLFLVTPDVDSRLARWMGQRWVEFKAEHLFYFNPYNLQNALALAGFEAVELGPGHRVLNAEKLNGHFQRYPVRGLTPLVAAMTALLPGPLRRLSLRLPTWGLRVMARPAPVRPRPMLSVVLPVYNEAATFPILIQAVLAKQIPGLDKEVIIVESGSTDGTRAQVQALESHAGVRVVYEERPQGKGHAVRQGLQVAQGDWILIQDGDLEYDIDDYDSLLAPLMAYQTAFVLGSRHIGDWKMRKYVDQPLAAVALNAGHLFFSFLLNLACGSHLKDPFTMFKVFRRDCLHGLEFKANRFDFDFELMIKLLRKGYQPIEVPVNYRSRSFKEGKKVRVFYDPMTWIWALIRFRLAPLYKK